MNAIEAFAREVIGAALDGCDGGDVIEEIAKRHGLIKSVPFDPAKHTDETGYAEMGDWWLVLSGPLAVQS